MSDHEDRSAAENAQAVKRLGEMMSTPQMLEELRIMATYRRLKYEAHIKAGFNPGQALYLCTEM